MKDKVAIIIPVWRSNLSEYEEISLRQCLSTLHRYKVILATYAELDIKAYSGICAELQVAYARVNFDPGYFCNISGYNRLLKSKRFYHTFRGYEYILIHQLDCFVFRDELTIWCEEDYSYIGAPWLEDYAKSTFDSPVVGVGNGGLSLRNVQDHLKVLSSFKSIDRPGDVIMREVSRKRKHLFPFLFDLFYKLIFCNNTFFLFNRGVFHEDVFWSVHANRFPWYTIPDWKTAAGFSVEAQPQKFIKSTQDMPFGCHAWWKYDLEFWRPYIKEFGYDI